MRKIRNPEKWIGKRVKHLTNWTKYDQAEDYFVDSWTGKLWSRDFEYYPTIEEQDALEDCSAYRICDPYTESSIHTMMKVYGKAA